MFFGFLWPDVTIVLQVILLRYRHFYLLFKLACDNEINFIGDVTLFEQNLIEIDFLILPEVKDFRQSCFGPVSKLGTIFHKHYENFLFSFLHLANWHIIIMFCKHSKPAIFDTLNGSSSGLAVDESLLTETHAMLELLNFLIFCVCEDFELRHDMLNTIITMISYSALIYRDLSNNLLYGISLSRYVPDLFKFFIQNFFSICYQ